MKHNLPKTVAKFILKTTGLYGLLVIFMRRKRKATELRLLQPHIDQGKELLADIDVYALRQKSLAFFEALRIKEGCYGRFRYTLSLQTPILYASAYAACLRHLYGSLEEIDGESRSQWIDYIQSHQQDDGLFADAAVDCPEASSLSWWGWQHLTLHVLMALSCLGSVARKPLKFIEPYYDGDFLTRHLESQPWNRDPANVSNEVQNIGVFLQYSRDYHHDERAGHALAVLYDWLDRTQNQATGAWGNYPGKERFLTETVQTGYHIWLLYFYDNRPLKYVESVIDTVLKTQNKTGGFGMDPNSSGCEDIDSLDPLVRLSLATDYRKEEIRAALEKVLPWVLANFNSDGSAVFRRLCGTRMIHENMEEKIDEGSAYATWWRTLSLAYLGQILVDTKVGQYPWKFVRCPGHQFFRGRHSNGK